MFNGRMVVRGVEAFFVLSIIQPGDQDLSLASVFFALALVAFVEGLMRLNQHRMAIGATTGTAFPADIFPTLVQQALDRAQAKVTVFTYVPSDKIKQTIGLVRGISDTEASSQADFALAEREALLLLLKHAHDLGANAVVGVQLTTGTYETSESKWQVSRPIYTGTAVRI
jgi:uncharacterized protein YbjQ (UPF0145 family)